MSFILRQAPKSDIPIMERFLRRTLTSDAQIAQVIGQDGSIKLMAAFEHWTDTGAEAHVMVLCPAAARYANEILRPVFAAKKVLWALVDEGSKSLSGALRLGFRETGRVPGGSSYGGDLVVISMTRDEFARRDAK